MPLRDHFRPPVDQITSWEALHGMWPGTIVRQLRKTLPKGYIAAPAVHLGPYFEIDVATYDDDRPNEGYGKSARDGGTATAVYAPPAPSVTIETELPDYDEYEVRIYDLERDKLLVAAIEIVSPANKDRAAKRNAFVGKCAALLQKGVAVSIVDPVTVRHHNLYAELMDFVGQTDKTLSDPPPSLYAVSCRWMMFERRATLQTWSNPLVLGQPLPTLPLWLSATLAVPLDLEASYEQACHDLWIT
jgi:hypothetical protein